MDLLIYQVMQQRMDYLSTRQSVIASNIANANTPNFKAQDVEKPDFKRMVNTGKISAARTHAGHMSLQGASASPYKIDDDSSAFETSPNGNSVSLEDQVVKMNEVAGDYRTTTTLYRKMNEMMRVALTGNNGS